MRHYSDWATYRQLTAAHSNANIHQRRSRTSAASCRSLTLTLHLCSPLLISQQRCQQLQRQRQLLRVVGGAALQHCGSRRQAAAVCRHCPPILAAARCGNCTLQSILHSCCIRCRITDGSRRQGRLSRACTSTASCVHRCACCGRSRCEQRADAAAPHHVQQQGQFLQHLWGASQV